MRRSNSSSLFYQPLSEGDVKMNTDKMTQEEKNARALTLAGCSLLGAIAVAFLVGAIRTAIDGNPETKATVVVK